MPTALEQTYLEIGRLYVQSLEFSERVQEYLEILELVDFSDVVDYASKVGKVRGKPNCTPGKSQWCPGKGGAGGCVSLKKQCRVKPVGSLGVLADFNTKAVNPAAEPKPKKPRTHKSKAKAQTAADDLNGRLMALRQKTKGYTLADEKRLADLTRKQAENPDDTALLSKLLVAQDKFRDARDKFKARAGILSE